MRLHGFLIGQTETLLAEVLKLTGPADATTSRFFRAHPKLGHGERGVIAEAVFAVLRRRMEFAHLAEGGAGSPARRMALLGLMQTAGRNALKPFVSEQELSWLEHVSKIDPESLPLRIRLNLPDWIYRRSQTRFEPRNWRNWRRAELPGAAGPAREPDQGEPRRRAERAVEGRYRRWRDAVRAVRRAGGRQAAAHQAGRVPARLGRSPGRGQPVAVFAGRAQARRNDRGLLRGRGRQDAGAGRGDALHRASVRLRRLRAAFGQAQAAPRAQRAVERESGADRQRTRRKIKRLAGKIDRVLVDAPCSGLGTLRRIRT
jgi:tRNA and rRNA cytosine-C5-methylases